MTPDALPTAKQSIRLRHENGKTVWDGTYRGVTFEVQNWKGRDSEFGFNNGSWTHYLLINLSQLPERVKPQSFWLRKKTHKYAEEKPWRYYDYGKHPILGAIDFPGGATWYSKEMGFDGDEKVIRIGCDYQHSWDTHNHYNLPHILYCVKKSIDSLHELIPDMKVRCYTMGGWHDQKDGRFQANGEFISAAGDRWRAEQGWQLIA